MGICKGTKERRNPDFWKERNRSVLRIERPTWIAVLSAPAMNRHQRVFHLRIILFRIQIPGKLIPFLFTWLPIPTPPGGVERTEHLHYSLDWRSRQFMKIQDTVLRRNNGSWTNKNNRCSFYHSNSIFRWGNRVPEVKYSPQSTTRPELEHHFPICQDFPHFTTFSPSHIQSF